jgi:hypothetical protein
LRLRAFTDLGEIDKFVKQHAEANPLSEAAVSYWSEKSAARILTAAQMARLWQHERKAFIEVKVLSLSNIGPSFCNDKKRFGALI